MDSDELDRVMNEVKQDNDEMMMTERVGQMDEYQSGSDFNESDQIYVGSLKDVSEFQLEEVHHD